MVKFKSNLKIGEEYKKEDIENIFNTGLGSRIRGIIPKEAQDGSKYILIFSKFDGPYNDKIKDNIIFYVGEGSDKTKDQQMIRGNRILAESNNDGRIIYGFVKERKNAGWKYIGILDLLDLIKGTNEYNSRVYEYKLKVTGLESYDEIKDESKKIEELSNIEPSLTDDKSQFKSYNRKARDHTFGDEIKEAYEFRCAVCGKKRFNKANNPEVEGAHIYPKEKNGSDDRRNGISLCKLHHWAFEYGLFTIKEDYTIIVDDTIKNDANYEEIYSFEGKKIILPKENKLRPHKLFLQAHRKMHGFQ